MQRISQSLTGNHALSWLLKMPSIKKKMPSLSTNQRSVILPFIDKLQEALFSDRTLIQVLRCTTKSKKTILDEIYR